MSRVQISRFYAGEDPSSIQRAIEAIQEFSLEQDSNRKSASYTLDPNDDLILVTTGASAITITLPYIDDAQRKPYYVKKIDAGAGAVTVQGSGTEVIDGGTVSLASQYDVVHVIPERTIQITTPIRTWHIV